MLQPWEVSNPEFGSDMGDRAAQLSPRSAAAHPLLRQLASLDLRQHQDLACAMSILWDEFVAEVGGPTGWVSRSKEEQARYIRSLALAAERIRLSGDTAKDHYALAPELMAQYVHWLRADEPPGPERELASIAVALAARGGLIRVVDTKQSKDVPATAEAAG